MTDRLPSRKYPGSAAGGFHSGQQRRIPGRWAAPVGGATDDFAVNLTDFGAAAMGEVLRHAAGHQRIELRRISGDAGFQRRAVAGLLQGTGHAADRTNPNALGAADGNGFQRQFQRAGA